MQLLDLMNQLAGFDFQASRQLKNGAKARLPLAALQERQRGGMEAGEFRECFVRKLLFTAETQQSVSESLGRIQVSILD